MKIAICDDEKSEILKIEEILFKIDGDYQVHSFQTGEALLSAVAKEADFDLVFLDIYLKNENGIEVAKQLKKLYDDINIVFTTVSRDYAVEAFSVQALHYIVKPFGEDDIFDVFKRIGRRKEMRTTLTIRIERSINMLFQDEILKVESNGHRTMITMIDGRVFFVRKSFGEITGLLDNSFINIKKGVTVSMHHIAQLRSNDCTLTDGKKYLLQRNRKQEIKDIYHSFAMNKMKSN